MSSALCFTNVSTPMNSLLIGRAQAAQSAEDCAKCGGRRATAAYVPLISRGGLLEGARFKLSNASFLGVRSILSIRIFSVTFSIFVSPETRSHMAEKKLGNAILNQRTDCRSWTCTRFARCGALGTCPYPVRFLFVPMSTTKKNLGTIC